MCPRLQPHVYPSPMNPRPQPPRVQVCVFAAGVAAHQLHERGAPTCAATADAAAEQLQATLLHLVRVRVRVS